MLKNVYQTIIVKNIEKINFCIIFSRVSTFCPTPPPPKSMLKWCNFEDCVPVQHFSVTESQTTCPNYFCNIDLGGKGIFCPKIKFVSMYFADDCLKKKNWCIVSLDDFCLLKMRYEKYIYCVRRWGNAMIMIPFTFLSF